MDAHRLSERPLRAATAVRWAALIGLLAMAGCSSVGREEMTQQVLKHDPAFQVLLDQRDALEGQVDDLHAQLAAKRTDSDQQIRAIEREFRETRTRLEAQVRALIQQLAPERDKLQLEIKTTRNVIRTDEATVQGLKKTIAELERSLSRSGSTAPPPPHTPAATLPAATGVLPPTADNGPQALRPQDRAALESESDDAQQALQHAQTELTTHRDRLNVLQYKLRLLRIN